MTGLDGFPHTRAAIEDGIGRGMHTGVQICVSVNGRIVLDDGCGHAAPGRAMDGEIIMPWRSAAKPLTALLILKAVETGTLSLNSRIADVIPTSLAGDKQNVTISQLLTHESGFPQTDTGWPACSWEKSVSAALQIPRTLDPGVAAYHPQSSWFVLGEILRQLTGLTNPPAFSELVRTELLNPLGMWETSCGFSDAEKDRLEHRLPALYERQQGELAESRYSAGLWLTRTSPGGSFRGPVADLVRFLEVLRQGGRTQSGTPFVSPETVRLMTSRHRIGKFDQTLQHVVDFGLGIVCDSNSWGVSTVPYGFGAFCSPSSFGHGGSQCSMTFCDPDRRLTVAWSANGFCGEGQHQRRNRLINEAIYQDLGFTHTNGKA